MNQHDLTPFESDLLTELRGVVAERGATSPLRRRRPVLAAAATGIAALATGVTVASLAGSPAYAVDTTAEGDIVVRIHELTDADGLERALAERGVTAEVSYGGESTGTVMMDDEGNVTPGPAPEMPEMPEPAEEPATGADPEASWSAEGAPESSGPIPAGQACGDVDNLPVSLVQDGSDYVITIDGDSAFAKEDLRITTLSRDEGAELVVSFSPAAGMSCGLGTATR